MLFMFTSGFDFQRPRPEMKSVMAVQGKNALFRG